MKYSLPDMKALALEQYCEVAATKRERGNALLLAKALTELFGDGTEDLEELREATIETVIRRSREVLNDPVACDQLQGEPLRALALEMGRQLEDGTKDEGK